MASTSEGVSATTIDPREAAHFGAMAADWWDPRGSSAMLHQLNPVRLGYIRDRIDQHWGFDECDLKPLKGRSAADVGCGAGLLAEPLARLGAEVTGVDPAPENIAAAQSHALGQGLAIDYRVGSVEALTGRYDLITCLEVVEHVSDTRGFVLERFPQGIRDEVEKVLERSAEALRAALRDGIDKAMATFNVTGDK